MDELTEQDLVKAAREGDLSAFETLVRSHEDGVRAFFRVRVFDWSEADDLAQDVFVTAFKRIATFRGDSRFASWLRGIATNHMRNYFRRRRDEPVGGGEELQALFTEQIDLHYGEQWDDRENRLEESVLLAALERCLKKLGQPERTLLAQRYEAGKTVRQISDGTHHRYSALVMQLLRIRRTLAACIRRQTARTA